MQTLNDHYSQYTFEQLAEAYQVEADARKALSMVLSRERKTCAGLRYDRDKFEYQWLSADIKHNVSTTDDIDVALDNYFRDRTRRVWYTPSMGYICTVDMEDCVFISFAKYNKDEWRRELVDMKDLLYGIAHSELMPIRWTGVNNVLKNHSFEVSPGLYELKL